MAGSVPLVTRIFDVLFPEPAQTARAAAAGATDSLSWLRTPVLLLVAFLAALMMIIMAVYLGVTHQAPSPPKGWADRDYDAV